MENLMEACESSLNVSVDYESRINVKIHCKFRSKGVYNSRLAVCLNQGAFVNNDQALIPVGRNQF